MAKNKKPKFHFENCCSCGVNFAMSRELYDYRKKDGKEFYCPNGHAQHYTQLTDDQKKLQAERDAAVKEIADLKAKLAAFAQTGSSTGVGKTTTA